MIALNWPFCTESQNKPAGGLGISLEESVLMHVLACALTLISCSDQVAPRAHEVEAGTC